MATRINFKFIAIAFMVTVSAGVIIGGLWILQTRGDAAYHAELAETAFAEGNYVRAAESFRRALRRDPANKEYLRRVEDSILRIRPQTLEESRERYGDLLNVLRHEAMYDPRNPDAHLRLIRELYSNARLLAIIGAQGQTALWEQVDRAAGDMINHVPQDHDKHEFGRLYRGVARIQLHAVSTDDVLERAMDDIRAFVEANPDDDFGHAALINSERLLVRHIGVRRGARWAQDRRRSLTEHIDRALDTVADGPRVRLAYARYLQQQLVLQPAAAIDGPTADQLRRSLDDLIDAARTSDDPLLVLESANLIAASGVPDSLESAISLLQAHIDGDPEALAHRFFLASFQRQARDLDSAHAAAQQIVDAEPIGVRFIGQMQSSIRRLAAGLITDIQFQRWANAANEEERANAIEQLDQARQQLASLTADPENDAGMMRANARYYLARGEHRRAAMLLERLIRDGTRDHELFLHASYVLEQIGELGLAYDRVVEAVDALDRPSAEVLHRKAHLELRLGRVSSAQATAEQLKNAFPEHDLTAQVSAVLRGVAAGGVAGGDDPTITAIRAADAALRQGDIDAARSAIYGVMEDDELIDVRLHIAAAQIEISVGEFEQAQIHVDRGLAIDPESVPLHQLQASLTTRDPLEAVRYFIENRESDPAQRNFQMMLAYAAMAEHQRRTAAQLREWNMHAEAAESRELSERADREARDLLRRLDQEHANDRRVLDYEFNVAVRDRNWREAESVLARAERAGMEQADLSMYRGLLALDRGELTDAVRSFQRAVDRLPFSADAWRGLALSYQRIGNAREALRAYEQSYRINPNDPRSLRLYLGLLLQTGEESRALRIIQESRTQVAHIPEFRELWLQLEAEHGDLAVAVKERERTFRENPDNRRNAVALALLLAQQEPRPELIFDEDGERRFAARRWDRMSVRERRQIIERTAEEWRRIAHTIADDIIDKEGSDLELVALKATLHRVDGDYEQGNLLLRNHIDAEDDPERKVEAFLALAQYQVAAGRTNDAIATARQAIEHQPSGQRDADQFLAQLLVSHNMYQQAIPHFERVVEVLNNPRSRMQLIECHLNIGRVDHAEAELNLLENEHEPTFDSMMLRAAIYRAKVERHIAAGEQQEARRQQEELHRVLSLAENMMPSNPMPHVQRAQALLSEYRRTNRSALLREAMTALSGADAVRPGDPRTRMTRIEVLRAMNNVAGAISEANRLIEQSPQNVQYRHLLVHLHQEAGQSEQALEAAREAALAFPHSPTLQRMLGDLRRERGRLAEAAQDYLTGYTLSGDPTLLRRAARTLLEIDPPQHQQVIELLREHGDAMEADPVLAGYFARAMYGIGREAIAERYMRESFAAQRSLIERGERHPSDINAWFDAFNPVFTTRPPQEMEALIMELAEDRPDQYMSYWIGQYWHGAGKEGYSRAIEIFSSIAEQVAQLDDVHFNAEILFNLATVQYQAENYRAAVDAYRKVLEILPGHALVLNNVAFILAEYLGSAEEAWTYASQALELAPQHHSVLDTAGWIQFKLGNHGEAETLLRRSLDIQETAVSQVHLARLLAATDRHDAALDRLRRAGELQPDESTRGEIDRLVDDIRTTAGLPQ